MAENKNDIVLRPQISHYMNMGTPASPKWVQMGDGFTKMDESPNAQTESVKYINQNTSSTDTVSYNAAYGFEADMMIAQPPIKKVYDVFKDRLIGSAADVEILTVDNFDGDKESGFTARKELCTIAVSSTSENNNKMKITGNFNVKGDPVKGKFVPADSPSAEAGAGTFTPDTKT